MTDLGDVRLRKALRELDHARFLARCSYVVAVLAAAFSGVVTWGWIATITWGLQGMGQPSVDKTGAMVPFVVGLLVGTIVAVGACGFAGACLFASLSDRRDALEKYEDLALELAS